MSLPRGAGALGVGVASSHHERPVHELVLFWESDLDRGLSEKEAESRLDRFGPNALPRNARHGPLMRLLGQFHNPLIYVLLAAMLVTLAVGHVVDALVIAGVVLVNAFIGFMQEWRAGEALEALAAATRTHATVLRRGILRRIDSLDVVPGDLVLIEAGDKVPADVRLTSTHELRVDESALTGESVPVGKEDGTLAAGTVLGDRVNMAYSGTFVTAGTGRGLVVATGVETEIGRIHQLVGEAEGVTTPLTRRLSAFSRWLTIVIMVLAGLTLAVGVLRGEGIAEMVTAAVALAVGAIPEGLPAAVTITLAIGVSRMARCHAIIRRLPAAETLGSTTVICTDKTGTLTQNRMTVQYVFAHGLVHQIEDADPDHVGPCLTAGTLCNNADIEFDDAGALTSVGDSTEVALLVGAFTAGEAAAGEEATWPRIAGAFGLFEWSSSQGASLDHARTVAVNAFVAMEIGYLFNCRALNRSLLSVGLFTNRLLLAGVAGTIALQLAFTYLPIMNAAFQSAPLTWSDWVAVVVLGVAIYLVVGTEKWISARVNRRAGQPDESSPHLDRPRLPGEVPRC